MILEDYLDPLCYDAAFWMAGVYSPDYPLAELGDLSISVCAKLRTVAITVLVSAGKTNGFFHNLIRSGRVRERYLERCLNENALEDHHRCSGRIGALLDTIAAGDNQLARRIASLSPSDWLQGREYEDDYCYAQLIHGMITGDESRSAALLVQFEKYLEGGSNARLDLMKALAARAQPEFDAAFEQLLLDRSLEIQKAIERGELEEPPVVAERRIFIEGLAILRLAENRGLGTENEYLFCPSIARGPMTEPFPGE